MPISLIDVITSLGKSLGFDVQKEVVASEGAWVDVVWFDKRLSPTAFGMKTSTIRRAPVLPVVGFEVELATGGNAKHIKGSISNLNNLGAQLSVIVIGNASVAGLKKRTSTFTSMSDKQVEKILMDRVYGWAFAEARSTGRLVIMSQDEVLAWAQRRDNPRLRLDIAHYDGK